MPPGMAPDDGFDEAGIRVRAQRSICRWNDKFQRAGALADGWRDAGRTCRVCTASDGERQVLVHSLGADELLNPPMP
jgi:hypothetical protein